MRLDVGCGGNEAFPDTSPDTSTVSIDIRKPRQPRATFVQASAEALPFKDQTFTHAVSYEVLEHVTAPLLMLRELRRVAQHVTLTTPNGMHLAKIISTLLRGDYQPHADHISVWNKAELTTLCRRAGFAHVTVQYVCALYRNPQWFTRVAAWLPIPALRSNLLTAICR